jgi:hypothetical protein
MKPPRRKEGHVPATRSLLEVSTALAAGRLASLLRGDGLTRETVEELLRPESAAALRSILTDHLGAPRGTKGPAPGRHSPPGGGKLLAFKAREGVGRRSSGLAPR